jgi:hypothetical protein
MALPIIFVYSTGGNYKATLKRASDGFIWNHDMATWDNPGSPPTYNDQVIQLVEGTDESIGKYSVSVAGLGDAGTVEIDIHDTDDSESVVGRGKAYVMGGDEVENASGISLTAEQQAALEFMLDINKLGEVVNDAANTTSSFLTNMTTANGFTDQSLRVLSFGANGNDNDTQSRFIISGGHNLTTGLVTVNKAFAQVPEDEDEFRVDGFTGT